MSRIPKNILKTTCLLVALSLTVACGTTTTETPNNDTNQGPGESPTLNIIETAAGAGSFGTLLAAVDAAGLTDVLKGEGPFTVFAPTDAAFAALGDRVGTLLEEQNKALLGDILTFHVLGGAARAADLSETELETVNGASAAITMVDGKWYFAGSEITTTDIETTNGVIHVITTVALPPLNIVERAIVTGGFDTLVAAVRAADLGETLSGGEFTVFAPTDAAFADVDADALADLLKPENKAALAGILTFHVLGAKVLAADVSAGDVTTVNGAMATIGTEGGVTYAGAKVIATDVPATNGVIHVIDAVVFPPAM